MKRISGGVFAAPEPEAPEYWRDDDGPDKEDNCQECEAELKPHEGAWCEKCLTKFREEGMSQ